MLTVDTVTIFSLGLNFDKCSYMSSSLVYKPLVVRTVHILNTLLEEELVLQFQQEQMASENAAESNSICSHATTLEVQHCTIHLKLALVWVKQSTIYPWYSTNDIETVN